MAAVREEVRMLRTQEDLTEVIEAFDELGQLETMVTARMSDVEFSRYLCGLE